MLTSRNTPIIDVGKHQRQMGTKNSNWKGEKASKAAGHARACVLFELPSTCENCGAPTQLERHHKDGNALHNSKQNIQFVCRRCHMILDGRIYKMKKIGLKGVETQNEQRRNGTWINPCLKGELNPQAKLTEKQVSEIKASNEDRNILAKRYGISPGHIWKIRSGMAWAK